MDKPREFWILESGCSIPLRTFYSEEDSFDEMQINDRHIHVIEYSAYEQLQKRFEEALKHIRQLDASPGEEHFIGYTGASFDARDFLRSLDKEKLSTNTDV